MRGPRLQIFIWTVSFAALSVLLTFALGLTLAVILQWPHLRFKTLFRILLFLRCAVPAFIAILVFRGLFNQNFGEINLILQGLFGIRPNWFTDAGLARVMLLIFVLAFIGFINDYPIASVLIRSEQNMTLAVGSRRSRGSGPGPG